MTTSNLVQEPFFRETGEERARIMSSIRINGQALNAADWLQVDTVMPIQVPDGFRGIVYPDSHSPWEHNGVLRAIYEFAHLYQPHLAFDIGDFLDLGRMSRWPANVKEGNPYRQQGEVDAARRQLRSKMHAGNPAKLIVMPGNHDDRERRQLSEKAAMFGDMVNGVNRNMLTDLATNVLGFQEKDPVMFAWGAGQQGGREGGVMVGDVRLRHGNFVDPKPGYSAYKHWLKQLVSTFIGHVHRAGDFAYETKSGAVKRGGELGHNADARKPGFNYISTEQDWIHAFGVMQAHNGVVHMQVIPMLLGEDEEGDQLEYFSWIGSNCETVEFAVRDN